MRLPPSTFALIAFLIPPSIAAADPKTAAKPCTLHSPSLGSYFDLRPLQVPSKSSPSTKDAKPESWHSKGYDYGSNFTLNFCGPVVEDLQDVEGIPRSRWQNVSAFYTTEKDEIYSIGQSSSEPIFRGRKLVLNYTGGSPCPELDEYGHSIPLLRRKILGGDDKDDDDDNHNHKGDDSSPPKNSDPSKTPIRHKSTLISFLCDRDPSLTIHPQISFIGTADHCSYFFEVRSRHACPGVSASNEAGSLGPGGVFGVIIVIALLAYLVGGCAYQRTVMHQRGWRQVPNYAVWAGILSFFGDIFIILFSSCSRHLPTSFNRAFNSRSGSSGGYHRVGAEDRGGNNNGSGPGRGRTPDDENRLIDQLDEEWDD